MNSFDGCKKLCIGTAQFGASYGVANATGKVDSAEIENILRSAREVGVDAIDTAMSYGCSEEELGRHNLSGFRIVTKLPMIPDSAVNLHEWLIESVKGSLRRLGKSSVDSLLLHRPDQLVGRCGDQIYHSLCAARDAGLCERIGVSVYGPEQLEALTDKYPVDLVQAPLNVFDQRMITSGWLERLKESGTALHVRSAFLQGLLLMDDSSRPTWFRRWEKQFGLWDQWLRKSRVTPLEACLRFVLSVPAVERVVVGVDSYAQWLQIINAASVDSPPPGSDLAIEDLDLVNPSRWFGQ